MTLFKLGCGLITFAISGIILSKMKFSTIDVFCWSALLAIGVTFVV